MGFYHAWRATAKRACVRWTGHGRIETRNLTTSEVLVGYRISPVCASLKWGGMSSPKTGVERIEVVYGVTSLSPRAATALVECWLWCEGH